MAFAAARIATLTPALFKPDDRLVEAHRSLASLDVKLRYTQPAGKRSGEQIRSEIKALKKEIVFYQREERRIWETLLGRHFGLLFEAFQSHPDKARLFVRLIHYCRTTGHNGFSRMVDWMRQLGSSVVGDGPNVCRHGKTHHAHA